MDREIWKQQTRVPLQFVSLSSLEGFLAKVKEWIGKTELTSHAIPSPINIMVEYFKQNSMHGYMHTPTGIHTCKYFYTYIKLRQIPLKLGNQTGKSTYITPLHFSHKLKRLWVLWLTDKRVNWATMWCLPWGKMLPLLIFNWRLTLAHSPTNKSWH